MNNPSSSNHQGIVGGVDTHKDLHFAAVVDAYDRVLANNSFPTTRHGYKSMLNWMQSFGEVKRIGVECTGTYGTGLLRYLQQFGIEILEITAPDKTDRRKRGKDDTIDAGNTAHSAYAAFAGIRTVPPPNSRWHGGIIAGSKSMQKNRHSSSSYRTTNDSNEYYFFARSNP